MTHAELAGTWLEAAGRPAIADRLEGIYRLVADQIEARGPACWASGRCCNFEQAGHRLYVTGLEAAYCLARLDGVPPDSPAIDRARLAGGCPFQRSNLCGVHAIKPLGCRTYFCDRSAQDWQHDVTERAHSLVAGVHEDFGVPYRYMEWRAMLELFATADAR
ncbi:MAG: hypothetical protein AAFX79_05895 [Planctomycetota bacterium]